MGAGGRVGRVARWVGLCTLCVCLPAAAQTDFTGEWRALLHEDIGHRLDEPGGQPGISGAGGPRIGDYTGLPLNDAARLRADSWDARLNNAREHQLIVHPGAYWLFNNGGMRIAKVLDPVTQQPVAVTIYRAGAGGSSIRTIWLDGRAHPPEYAAHSWRGFSTARWSGDTLIVTTTHLKAAYIRRNGVPVSDRATLTEYFARHGDYLTLTRIVEDPLYLDEPYVSSTAWASNPRQQLVEPQQPHVVDEVPGQPKAYVPHHLPGANVALHEFGDSVGIPFEATRGGAHTAYPEYQRVLESWMKESVSRVTR